MANTRTPARARAERFPAVLAASLGVLCAVHAAAAPLTINIADRGAAPGIPDNAPIIQRAIEDAEAAGGGTIHIPAASQPYTLRAGLTIRGDNITLDGPGATLRLADRALMGRIVDVVQVLGTPDDPATNIRIAGLTIDANYWNQPGSYNPRGFDSDHARNLTLENLTVTDAFVALTFGMNVVGAVATDCRVTRWYDDGFNASGDGLSGGARNIRFIRCTAENSPNEAAGGPPGARNNAWEIEDGAQSVLLEDCTVRDCGGSGFAVRNHPEGDAPVRTAAVTLRRCRAERVAHTGFVLWGPSLVNTVEDVLLEDCDSDSHVYIRNVLGLRLTNCRFRVGTRIGPVRDGVIEGGAFGHMQLWLDRVGGAVEPGAYQSAIRFVGVLPETPPWLIGNRHYVRLPDGRDGDAFTRDLFGP